MQCPNCGRNVRSKNQCAYCGHVFGNETSNKTKKLSRDEIEEEVGRQTYVEEDYEEIIDDDDYYDVPRKKRGSGGFWRVVWGILQLLIAVAVVFLAFLFGPRLYSTVMDYFQSDQSTQEVASSDASESLVDSASVEQASQEDATAAALTLSDNAVNVDNYPLVNVSLQFAEGLDQVGSDTFTFAVESVGKTTDLGTNYSLVKEGNKLNISFNDPSIAVVSSEAQQQILHIDSPSLNVHETVAYTIPKADVNADQVAFFNQTLTDNLASQGNVSAVVIPQDASVPFVYENGSTDADALISWYVIERTYEAIEAGELTLDGTIAVSSDLISSNEETLTSTTAAGEELTVQDLLTSVVQNSDVSALNHLIQATGGPNAFNLWLNESNYFATKVTQKLQATETGAIQGAVTSAQDTAQLLNALAKEELVSPENDAAFKELLLGSPLTNKFPADQITGYQSRYELASADTNTAQQNYAAIIELEDTYYVVVITAAELTAAEQAIPAVADTVAQVISFLDTGEESSSQDDEEPAAAAEEQVTIVEPAPAQPVVEGGYIGEDGRTYTTQYVENIGSYVDLPYEEIYDESTGTYRQANWFYNEEIGNYQYR